MENGAGRKEKNRRLWANSGAGWRARTKPRGGGAEKRRCGAGVGRNTGAMKSWLGGLLIGGVVATTVGAAEVVFSQTLPSTAFVAAGLEKLTPAELARLDALVRDYQSGALERARRETEAAEARAAEAERKAVAAPAIRVEPEKKADPGLLAKAKVLLTPGTKVEYAAVESRLAGEFRGWEVRTVFTLENGQRWQVTGGESYVTPPVPGPAVKIVPGALGSFWMTIEGVRPRVKVVRVDAGR